MKWEDEERGRNVRTFKKGKKDLRWVGSEFPSSLKLGAKGFRQ